MTTVPLEAQGRGPLEAHNRGLPGRAGSLLAAATWNPIVSKELRSRMRGWHAFALLTGYLCVIGGLGWIVYDADVGSAGNIVGLGSTGAQVFRSLAGVVMATVALVVPALVGPTISGERERQTLDLLLVTPLGPGRIVLGKLIAALAFVVLLVIACLPLFSVAFLLGGVGMAEVLEVVAFTLVGAVTIGALSMLVSVLVRRVSSATVVSYLVMLALTVGPIAAGYLLNRALSEPAQNGPAPFAIAEVNGTTGIVDAVSPAVGAASLLDSSDCQVVAPFFGSGVGVPIAVGCGPGGQYVVNLGPLGTWQAWEATFLLDGVIAVGALSASVYFLNRREMA
jgi:ABC-type transport system involved in multi-copper enzyme maturation permease subunit